MDAGSSRAVIPSAVPAAIPAAPGVAVIAFDAIVEEPFLKRPFDVALSAIMLFLTLPVWLMIAVAIKVEDGGPVFYRQDRWGRHGIRFKVLKFRTMIANSDAVFGVQQATQHDHRITRIGRFLRAAGLDELPQLLNILVGEMSFVGPRALAVDERDRNGHLISYQDIPGFGIRQLVRPGLTSIATIYLPKDAPARHKVRADLLYVRRLSFWLDLRLVAMSFAISFSGRWETRTRKL